ncbi:hypothetical protein EIP86_001011 [Pleurotus ostreatoroseus]|nr:hypothetical protein EIP86_001011 [Pleurotus ostreatoroseus]
MAGSEQVETSESSSGVSLAAAAPSEASGLKPAPIKIKIQKSKAHRTPIPADASGMRSCSMCKRSVPSEWPHRTCERCLERSRRSRERKRLLTMIEKALDADVEQLQNSLLTSYSHLPRPKPVTCTICTQIIPVPPNQGQGQPRRQQFVLCSSCQGKMISANAPARSRVGRSTLVPGAPGVPPAIHIVADGPDVGANTLAGAVPAAAGGVLATKTGIISPPIASTSTLTPQLNRPGLVQGWSFDIQKTIERLVNTPHLNSKGEYINPQFLPRASSKANAGNGTAVDIIFQPSPTVRLPSSLLMRPPAPLHTSAISPVDVTPRPPVSLASTPGTSRRSNGPGSKKPPTIRIPPRPSYFHPSSQLATPASASTVFTPASASASFPFPSPSQPIVSSASSDSAFSRLYANASAAAPGHVRLCATRGCNAVLSKTHKWILCNRCLKCGSTENREEETDGESTLVGDVEKGKEKERNELTEHTSPHKGKERAWVTEKEQAHPAERLEARHMSEPTSGETKAIPPITIRRASEPAAMADRSISSGVIRLPPLRDAHAFAQRRRSKSATPRTGAETVHREADANGDTAGGLPTPPPSATTISATVSGFGAEDDDGPPPMPMSTSFEAIYLNDAIMRPPSPVSPAQEKHKDSAYKGTLNMQMDVDSDANTPLISDSDGDLSDLTPLTESDDDDDDDSSEDEVDALDLVRKRVAMAQQDTSSTGIQDSTVPKTRPPPNPKLSYVCRGNKCQNLIPPRSRWKTCQPCRKRFREYCRQRTDKQPKWMKQDLVDDEGKEDQDEVFISPDGHRKCTIRSCYNIIPPVEQYRWKMCESCRTRTRRGARKRRYGVDNISGDERDPSAYDIKFKKLKLLFKGVHVASVEAAEHGETPAQAIEVERHTVYQTFEELLEVFRNRFAGFVTAQAQYLRFKLAQADIHPQRPPSDPPSASGDPTKESGTSEEPNAGNEVQKPLPVINLDTKPMHFSFEGECSVVADPAGGEVASRIQLVQASVADLLGVDFGVRPPQYRVDEDQRIVGLFGCVCDVLVPLPALRSGATAATSDVEAGGTGQAAVKEVQEKGLDSGIGSDVADGQADGKQDAMQVDGDAGEGSANGKDKEQASMDKDPSEKAGYQEKEKHIESGTRNDMAVKRMSGELEVSVVRKATSGMV